MKKTAKKTALKSVPATTTKRNVADIVTDAIIAKLEQGVIPWKKPWNGSALAPRNYVTGKAYRGINAFLLANTQFASPYFLTFKQIIEKKASLKAGSKGFPVVFWSMVKGTDSETGDETSEKSIPFMRYYTVFSIEQTSLEVPAITETPLDFNPIEEAEKMVASMPFAPEIRHGQAKAFYSPSLDYVNLPKRELFHSSEEYYNVLFHELGHSTGHKSRLARKGVTESSYFGSHEYSKEELVAEMTAAFCCSELGIIPATLDNSAAYIQSWLKALKSQDNRNLIVSAASQAQKAFDYILDRKPVELAEAA
jgi:antirestriction protein ArdC